VRDERKSKHKHAVGDERQTEEGGTTESTLGVVEEAVDASVRETSGNLLNEEEVRVEPSKVAEDLVGRGSGPEVERDEGKAENVAENGAGDGPVAGEVVGLPSKANERN